MGKILKYLIHFKGEKCIIANNTEEMKEIIKNHAQTLRERKCEYVDFWYSEMKFYHCSRFYDSFPDFILPLNEQDIKYLKEMLDK